MTGGERTEEPQLDCEFFEGGSWCLTPGGLTQSGRRADT